MDASRKMLQEMLYVLRVDNQICYMLRSLEYPITITEGSIITHRVNNMVAGHNLLARKAAVTSRASTRAWAQHVRLQTPAGDGNISRPRGRFGGRSFDVGFSPCRFQDFLEPARPTPAPPKPRFAPTKIRPY